MANGTEALTYNRVVESFSFVEEKCVEKDRVINLIVLNLNSIEYQSVELSIFLLIGQPNGAHFENIDFLHALSFMSNILSWRVDF